MSNIAKRRSLALSEGNEEYIRRRTELIEVGAEVFHAKGLKDASLGDIAEVAGVDRASVYYYFANKYDLFAAVIRDATSAYHIRVGQICDENIPPKDRLNKLIIALMENYGSHYPNLYIYIRENFLLSIDVADSLRDELTSSSEWAIAKWRAVIAEGLQDGSFKSSLPPGILAQTIIGAVSWSYRWYEPDRGLNPTDIGTGLADLILRGLALA
jgi:TetR/AcrR family transcriptional regulator, cholesterol catabolism regulator